jgi:oxalate decarboxylase
VVVKPGGLRELHWRQNADAWQYYIQGQALMTVFCNGSKARTADRFMDLSLSDWMTYAPPALISRHLGISEDLLGKLPKDKTVIMPA